MVIRQSGKDVPRAFSLAPSSCGDGDTCSSSDSVPSSAVTLTTWSRSEVCSSEPRARPVIVVIRQSGCSSEPRARPVRSGARARQREIVGRSLD